MSLPVKLSIYFARHFLVWLMIGLATCTVLIFLIDFVEMLRKSAKADIGFITIIEITFLRLPNLLQKIIPFAVLFGAILSFTKLTKSRELVVARASGVSVWQFLSPSIITAILIGVFAITVFNPIAAAMNNYSTILTDKYLEGKRSQITVSESGLWLKQINEEDKSETLITAAGISADNRHFNDITIFEFTPENEFKGRIDAESGKLLKGRWKFKNVIVNKPGKTPDKYDDYSIETNLTLEQIQDSFNSPENVSFWELPRFIKILEDSGFSGLRHKLHFHTLLITPILLMAMVIIAAVFSLRYSRQGKTGLLVSAAVFTGFVFYFITKITASFGIAGSMPIILAAWTPAFIFIAAGAWLLLHLEDG